MLTCSLCGKRPASEFEPLAAEGASLEGADTEYWWHRLGCGRPTVVLRARQLVEEVGSMVGSRRAAAVSAMLSATVAVAETSHSVPTVAARSDVRVTPPTPKAVGQANEEELEVPQKLETPDKLEAGGLAQLSPPPPAPRRVRPPRPQLPIPKGTQSPVPLRTTLAPAESVPTSGPETRSPADGIRESLGEPLDDRLAARSGEEVSLWTSSRRLRRNDPAVASSVVASPATGWPNAGEVHAFSDQAEGAEQVVLSTSDRYADVVEYRYARSDVVSDASAGPPAGGAFPAGSHLDLTDRPSTDVDEAEHGRFRDRARLGGVQPQPRRSGVPTPWRTEAGEPREIQSGRRASVAVETEPDDHDEVPVDGAPVHDEIEVVGDDRAIDIGTEIEVVADRGEVELVADRGEVEVVADETSAPPRDAGDAGDARGAGDGGSALTAPQLSGMFARPPLENDPGGATPGHGHGSPAQRTDGGRDR